MTEVDLTLTLPSIAKDWGAVCVDVSPSAVAFGPNHLAGASNVVVLTQQSFGCHNVRSSESWSGPMTLRTVLVRAHHQNLADASRGKQELN